MPAVAGCDEDPEAEAARPGLLPAGEGERVVEGGDVGAAQVEGRVALVLRGRTTAAVSSAVSWSVQIVHAGLPSAKRGCSSVCPSRARSSTLIGGEQLARHRQLAAGDEIAFRPHHCPRADVVGEGGERDPRGERSPSRRSPRRSRRVRGRGSAVAGRRLARQRDAEAAASVAQSDPRKSSRRRFGDDPVATDGRAVAREAAGDQPPIGMFGCCGQVGFLPHGEPTAVRQRARRRSR